MPAGCAAYRITEIPRRREASGAARTDGCDPGRPQRAAALAAAYHAGIAKPAGTVAFGWVRAATGGPVLMIAAGDALVGSVDPADGEVLLALPGGARGTALPPAELAGLLGQLGCWREIAGISDGLLALPGETGTRGTAAGPGSPGRAGLSLDEGLLGSWTGPFGWLVTAEPVTPAELRALSEEIALRQRIAEGTADRFPERAAQARRLKERHGELQRGQSTGLWRVTIAAGGRDEPSAARIAGLLCASADLEGLPYALSPAPFSPGHRGRARRRRRAGLAVLRVDPVAGRARAAAGVRGAGGQAGAAARLRRHPGAARRMPAGRAGRNRAGRDPGPEPAGGGTADAVARLA